MKFIIEKDETIKDLDAFEMVNKVITQGLVSAKGTQYAYVTAFKTTENNIITVISEKKRYGYKFWVKRRP